MCEYFYKGRNLEYLNLLCDDFQINRFLDDGIIIWILLNLKEKVGLKSKPSCSCLHNI